MSRRSIPTPNQFLTLCEIAALVTDDVPATLGRIAKRDRPRHMRRLIDMGLVDGQGVTEEGRAYIAEVSAPRPWEQRFLYYPRRPVSGRTTYGYEQNVIVALSADHATTYVTRRSVKGTYDTVALISRTIPTEIVDAWPELQRLRVVGRRPGLAGDPHRPDPRPSCNN